jgi:hypothetical protein
MTASLSLLILGDAIVPMNAEEQIVARFRSGIKREAFHSVGDKRVGVRRWWNAGTLACEWATDGSRHHGRWVRFHTTVFRTSRRVTETASATASAFNSIPATP